MRILIVLLVLLVGCSSKKPEGLRTVDLLPGHTRSQHEATSQGVMITSQGTVSSQAGLEMRQFLAK